MRSALVLGLFALSSVASASVKVTEVYRVVEVAQSASDEWTNLVTASGSVVSVRCSSAQFDDSARDRVASFASPKECLDFVAKVKKHASPVNPVEVVIGADFGIEIRVGI